MSDCNDAVKIHIFHTNGTERAYAFLHESGHISGLDNDVNKNDCRRTKIYRINQTQVLVRFGEISKVVNNSEVDKTISSLLWKYDKITYALNEIGFYIEKKGVYDLYEVI